MTETEVDLTSDRVVVVDQIHSVRFRAGSTQGAYVLCGEDGPTVEIAAFIYYPGHDVHGIPCEVESVWSQHFCQTCIKSFFPTEDLVGYS
jgi:hypothetical protein